MRNNPGRPNRWNGVTAVKESNLADLKTQEFACDNLRHQRFYAQSDCQRASKRSSQRRSLVKAACLTNFARG
jgi:hypothetical protein